MSALSSLAAIQALQELTHQEEVEDIRMYMDLAIPDSMLEAFNKRYRITTLLSNLPTEKSGGTFDRRGQTWFATVYTYTHLSTAQKQLTVKLSHDGFRYHKRTYVDSGLSTHKRDAWFSLGEDVLGDMPTLRSLKNMFQANMSFLYNIKYKRIDVHFQKPGEESPFLLITFESGNPCNAHSRAHWF